MIAESQLKNSEATQAKVEAASSAKMAAHSAGQKKVQLDSFYTNFIVPPGPCHL